jgi:hypothetical protein
MEAKELEMTALMVFAYPSRRVTRTLIVSASFIKMTSRSNIVSLRACDRVCESLLLESGDIFKSDVNRAVNGCHFVKMKSIFAPWLLLVFVGDCEGKF